MAARGLHFLLGCLATAALLTPPAMAEGDQDCADGWTKFESRCFKFFEEKKSWTESEKSCQSLDANLVSIHSQEENVFVLNLIKKVTGGYPYTWLGGTDAEQEGVWKWSDGSVWDYSHWYVSEPSGGLEHYLMINFGVTFWNDVDNGKKLVYVCAKGLPPPATPGPKSMSLTLEGFHYQCTPKRSDQCNTLSAIKLNVLLLFIVIHLFSQH